MLKWGIMVFIFVLYIVLCFYLLYKASQKSFKQEIKDYQTKCPPHKWSLEQINKHLGDDTYYMVCQKCKRRPGDAEIQ